MSKMLKEVIARDLDRKVKGLGGFVAVSYQGLNSADTYDLRRSLRKAKVRMQVVPNRLASHVLAKQLGGADGPVSADGMRKLLKGPTALLLGQGGGTDPVIAAAKSIAEWQKKNKDKVQIKGGCLGARILSRGQVEELSKVPDARVLYSQIAGMFQAPLRNLASSTQQLIAKVVYALQAIKDKKEKEAGGAA